MAPRLDTATQILEMVPAYGYELGGTFHLDDGSYTSTFAMAALGRSRNQPPATIAATQVVYTEPGTGRQLVCGAFGRAEVAETILAILEGRLTAPNLGGYSATSRIPLRWAGLSGCYYVDQGGNSWGSMSSEQVTPCALCGRPTRGGYIAAMTDVLVCAACVAHVDEHHAVPPAAAVGGAAAPPTAPTSHSRKRRKARAR
jgi:hypothetical protein